MRIGFVTCVQIGLDCLDAVTAHGGHFEVVVTLPADAARAKSGRVDLDDFCSRTGTALLPVKNINDADSVEQLHGYALDWLLIVGWSQIARAPVLASARLGTLGMHPTLLPEGRGRAAIPWAILKGLRETGVTLFKLDEGVDSGPIAAQARIPMAPDETATNLYRKVAETHARVLVDAWPALQRGDLAFEHQDHSKATVWPGRRPENGRLYPGMSLPEAECLVRAVTHPYPGAFYEVDGGRLRVWRAVAELGPVTASSPGFDAIRNAIAFEGGALRLLDWQFEPA